MIVEIEAREGGNIVLRCGDESEALTHACLARTWARRSADLRVPAPGQAKKVAMLGSLCAYKFDQTKYRLHRHLEQLDALYDPRPGQVMKPAVVVEDNGPIHVSKASRAFVPGVELLGSW